MQSFLFPALILLSVAAHWGLVLLFPRTPAPVLVEARALPTQQGKNSIRLRASLAAAPKPLAPPELPPLPDWLKTEKTEVTVLPPPSKRPRPKMDTPPPEFKTERVVVTPVEMPDLPLLDVKKQPEQLEMAALPRRPRLKPDMPSPTLKTMTAALTPIELPDAPLPEVKIARTEEKPLPPPKDRPRPKQDMPAPQLKAETAALTPIEIPDLPLPPVKIEEPRIQEIKVAERPKQRPPLKDAPPNLEAVVKVAEMKSIESPGSEASRGTAVDEQPVEYATNPSPPYPAEALRNRIEGKVWLNLKIDAAGKVSSISINQSSGNRLLDESALETVRLWRFQPARRGGVPVPFEGLTFIEFYIRR